MTFKKPIPTEYKGRRHDSKSEAIFSRVFELAKRDQAVKANGNPDVKLLHGPMLNVAGHKWDVCCETSSSPPNEQSVEATFSYVRHYVEYKPRRPTETYIAEKVEQARKYVDQLDKMEPRSPIYVKFSLFYGSPWVWASKTSTYGGIWLAETQAALSHYSMEKPDRVFPEWDQFVEDAMRYRYDLPDEGPDASTLHASHAISEPERRERERTNESFDFNLAPWTNLRHSVEKTLRRRFAVLGLRGAMEEFSPYIFESQDKLQSMLAGVDYPGNILPAWGSKVLEDLGEEDEGKCVFVESATLVANIHLYAAEKCGALGLPKGDTYAKYAMVDISKQRYTDVIQSYLGCKTSDELVHLLKQNGDHENARVVQERWWKA